MNFLFKDIFKISKSRGVRYLLVFLGVLVLIVWGIIGIYKMGIVAIREVIQTTDYLIVEEQKRDLVRFEDKIIVAEEHIDELQDKLKDIKLGRWMKLSEEQKRVLLKITWELRKDSLRIENALINHQSDWSVNFYPRKDERIENKFKDYWAMYILIDRVLGDTERIVYSPQGVDKFQLQKLQEDIEAVKRMVDHK
jgi:hypothetical protein